MEMTTRPTVALIQSHWRLDPEQSLAAVLAQIAAIDRRVHLIVLPEFFLGPPWYFPGRQHLRGIIDHELPGPLTELFGKIARERDCYILLGTVVERVGELSYNTSALLSERGEILAKAHKIHRFSAEMLSIEAGTEQQLIDTPFGKLGICVCSDFWMVEMPRLLALRGAEIIVVPGAALARNLGITRPCIQASSAFNVCYTLFAGPVGSATGERGGREVTIELAGASTVASPEAILGSLEREEGVLYAELDLQWLRQERTVDPSFRRSLYWCLHGRRPELYGGLGQPYVEQGDLRSLLDRYLR